MYTRKSMMPRSVRRDLGFTLIELMIAVAIIGILAAIAMPSYTEYIRRGDRAAARAALLEAQQFMERYYAANSRYTTDAVVPTSPALPVRLQVIPSTSAEKYRLTLGAPTVSSYTLTATPTIADAKCGNLTLTSTGLKGQTAVTTGTTLVINNRISDCWK